MAVVTLQILEPAHNQVYTGLSPSVRLRGQVVEGPDTPLYFSWYSSLFEPPASAPNQTTLNANGDNPLNFSPALGPGSHVLTFNAKDQAGNDLAAIKAVQHSGMAGGAPLQDDRGNDIVKTPCVIHILTAELLAPQGSAGMNRASLLLKAKAPVQWGKQQENSSAYSPNPDYHKPEVNRLQYHWFFTPRGSPPRRSWDFVTPPAALTFRPRGDDNPDGPSVEVSRNGRAHLDTGAYRLTLRVEDLQNLARFHAVTRNITLS